LYSRFTIYRPPSAGPLEAIAPERLTAKSATLSHPVLFHYTAQRPILIEIAGRVFTALREGVLRVDVRHRYPLAAAADAHRDHEARRTTGPLVLLP
jgi:NADPH2:quinone reductase